MNFFSAYLCVFVCKCVCVCVMCVCFMCHKIFKLIISEPHTFHSRVCLFYFYLAIDSNWFIHLYVSRTIKAFLHVEFLLFLFFIFFLLVCGFFVHTIRTHYFGKFISFFIKMYARTQSSLYVSPYELCVNIERVFMRGTMSFPNLFYFYMLHIVQTHRKIKSYTISL